MRIKIVRALLIWCAKACHNSARLQHDFVADEELLKQGNPKNTGIQVFLSLKLVLRSPQ
jgi:hypothetical protein